jgi:hypothetical protein
MNRDNLDDMTPEEIDAWAKRKWEESKRAFASKPMPKISRVKREDYPHWEITSYGFHTRDGKRVLIDRGNNTGQVEGILRGVHLSENPDNDQNILVVEYNGLLWACVRADGENWDPAPNGRVQVKTLQVPVLAHPLRDNPTTKPVPQPEHWQLQSNIPGPTMKARL